MNKFYHSLTYRFQAQKGRRKHYFFNLVDRTTDPATFQVFEKGEKYLLQAKITIDNSSDIPTEIAKFTYNGVDITLRADVCMGKGYAISEEGQAEKRRDQQLDADLGLTPKYSGNLYQQNNNFVKNSPRYSDYVG